MSNEMRDYVKSISKNLPEDVVILKAGSDKKCPIDSNNMSMNGWTSRTESDIYDPNWTNYAILTGSTSDIWILDIDNKEDNIDEMNAFFEENDYDISTDAFTVQTPSGGYHIYYRYESIIDSYSKYKNHNDILRTGKCAMFIGSEFSKGSYDLICDKPIGKCPKFIMDAITKKDRSEFLMQYNNESERINIFLDMLNKDRCINYDDWIKVGMIIKNELGEQGFDLFNKFSKQDKEAYRAVDKTTRLSGENLARYKWNTFTENDKSLKIGSLIDMAKEDNPILVEKYKQREEQKRIIGDQKRELEEQNREIEKIEKEPLKFINKFEDDDFTMVKFLRHLDNTTFDNYIEAYKYIRNNLHRVCAIIGAKSLIIKNDKICNSDQITFERMKGFGEETLIRIKDKGLPLDKFIFTNKYILCRYEKVNSKILYEGNNTNDFYITRPYIGKMVEYKISDLDFILEFIRHIVCWDDEQVYNKFMIWLAFMVQFPNEKSGVVPVFISKIGGTGKSKFIEFIAFYVLGKHLYAPFSNIDGALQTQNKQLVGKKLGYVNEMGSTKEAFMSNYQKFKGYITESGMTIKALYKDPIFMDLYLEFILTANNIDCLPIEKKDRRFFPIRYNNERANNFEYFALFEKITWNEDYGNKFYSYLMDMENVNKSTVRDFPTTELKQEMLDNVTNSFDSFLDDLFSNELSNIINKAIKEDSDYIISCQTLYLEFVEYHKKFFPSDKYIIPYKKFISRIKSKDNTYAIEYEKRKNGHDRAQFKITLDSNE